MTHLHLIYIHGFRGDHTSFQRFPTDVCDAVRAKLDARFELSSYLYPTYPSVRPVAYATQQFLIWLAKQPPGPVILFAHSMGGLLAAEAATSPEPVAKRIIGLVGLDVPWLGLHPHVVISGIASLFPKDDPNVPREKELNRRVTMVAEHDAFEADTSSTHSTSSTSSGSHAAKNWMSGVLDKYKENPAVQFFMRHSDDPLGGVHRWIVKNLEFGSSMYDAPGLLRRYDALVRWDGHWVNYWTTTVPLDGELATAAPELLDIAPAPALSPGLGKNDAQPVLSLPFGFLSKPEPSESQSQSAASKWWHSALPAEQEIYDKFASYLTSRKKKKEHEASSNSLAPPSPSHTPLASESTTSIASATSTSSAEHSPHHFIVLPYNSGGRRAKWYRITVAHAKDEVGAHQGIFMRDKNPDYDAFVERVARLVERWSRNL